MFSEVRSTIRNQVWDKAGVYLNEDIILPLCDKWACTAHQLGRVVNRQSKQRSELLADAQNVLSENYADPNESGYYDDEAIARKLMDCSWSSNMEMYVVTWLIYRYMHGIYVGVGLRLLCSKFASHSILDYPNV